MSVRSDLVILTWCLRVFVVQIISWSSKREPLLSGRSGTLRRAGDRDAKRDRPRGDREVFVMREFLELAVERVTVRVDPEGDRGVGVGIPQAAEKIAPVLERLVPAFGFHTCTRTISQHAAGRAVPCS